MIKKEIDYREFLSKHDMVWNRLPKSWDECPFLGNGVMGLLIFQEQNYIRIELGRSDVQDHRALGEVAFQQARLPIGYIKLQPQGKILTGCMRLDLYNAEAVVEILTDKGRIALKSIVHSYKMVGLCEITCEGQETMDVSFIGSVAISPRQKWGIMKDDFKRTQTTYQMNPKPQSKEIEGINLSIQELMCGGGTTVAYATKQENNTTHLYINVSHAINHTAEEKAISTVQSVINENIEELKQTHYNYWNNFYEKTFVSIPDAKYEGFYWIQLYKLASATRANGVLIDNQGPWLWNTAWPYATWNLNVQLTYLPLCIANHVDLGYSLINTLYRQLDNLINNCPEDLRHDSAAIGTAATLSCDSGVNDIRVTNGGEIGNLTWAMHNCWMLYKYSMDETLLPKIYKILRRSVNHMLHFLYKEEGKYHLLNSGSPEYGNAVDCNYSLSLIRWGLQTLIEISELLALTETDKEKWQEILLNLVEYPSHVEQGFMIGKDSPYSKSHRHYSHLLMIYPLQLVRPDNEENREVILKSLNHWHSLPEALRGYSFTGGASMYALLGMGNEAEKCLGNLWSEFLRPNTMYQESGPVIETPLAAMQSLQEMLLQSYGETIRVFPAMPDKWEEASFCNLLAEGAVEVSAKRQNGKTVLCELKSKKDTTCTVELEIENLQVEGCSHNDIRYITDKKVELKLTKNQPVTLYDKQITSLQIKEVESITPYYNCYGLNQHTTTITDTTKTDFDLI